MNEDQVFIKKHLPDVAAHFHVGTVGRAGLPLCGSGPDNVWQKSIRCSPTQVLTHAARAAAKH